MPSNLGNAERVLASVAGLLFFALNEVRMFRMLPHEAAPAHGQIHALRLQVLGSGSEVFASAFDLALRWGLVGVTVALCAWALAETLPRPKQQAR